MLPGYRMLLLAAGRGGRPLDKEAAADYRRTGAYRFAVTLGGAIYFALLFHGLLIPLMLVLEVPALALFNVVSVAAWAAAAALFRRGRLSQAQLIGSLAIVAHAYVGTWLLGWASGFHYYILILAPLLFFNPLLTLRCKLLATAAACVSYLLLFALAGLQGPAAIAWAPLFGYLNSVLLFGLSGFLAFHYSRAAELTERRMQRANRLLEGLATTDPLTGLLNRRRMLERLEAEARGHSRCGARMALLLADIDNFKSFNDRHGHECGDFVLERLAQVLRQVVRGRDQVARWGGEEFLVLLPDADTAGAREAAERLRAAVAEAVFRYGDRELGVTVTIGISEYRPGEPLKELIGRADELLLQGKRRGRNQVLQGEVEPALP